MSSRSFSVYVIGDLHLSLNPQTQKPMDVFGGAWVNHSNILKKDWDERVCDDDIVVLAGDISWAMSLGEAMIDLAWIDSLKGKKVIIKGNHDLWWCGIKKLNSLFDSIYFLQNDCFVYEDVAICGSRGWVCEGSDNFTAKDKKVYERELLRLRMSLEKAKKSKAINQIGFMHYPPTNEKKDPSKFTTLFREYGICDVYYGHLHGREAERNKAAYVCEGVRCKLISLDALNCKLYKVL